MEGLVWGENKVVYMMRWQIHRVEKREETREEKKERKEERNEKRDKIREDKNRAEEKIV